MVNQNGEMLRLLQRLIHHLFRKAQERRGASVAERASPQKSSTVVHRLLIRNLNALLTTPRQHRDTGPDMAEDSVGMAGSFRAIKEKLLKHRAPADALVYIQNVSRFLDKMIARRNCQDIFWVSGVLKVLEVLMNNAPPPTAAPAAEMSRPPLPPSAPPDGSYKLPPTSDATLLYPLPPLPAGRGVHPSGSLTRDPLDQMRNDGMSNVGATGITGRRLNKEDCKRTDDAKAQLYDAQAAFERQSAAVHEGQPPLSNMDLVSTGLPPSGEPVLLSSEIPSAFPLHSELPSCLPPTTRQQPCQPLPKDSSQRPTAKSLVTNLLPELAEPSAAEAAERKPSTPKQPPSTRQTPVWVILRDCLFALQGIDGQHIKWDSNEAKFLLRTDVVVDAPLRQLVSRICLAGSLYRYLSGALGLQTQNVLEGAGSHTAESRSNKQEASDNRSAKKQRPSIVRDALDSKIKEELTEYYRVLALMEQEAFGDRTLQTFSLSALSLWLSAPYRRLRFFARVVSLTRCIAGGQVLTVLHILKSQTGFTEELTKIDTLICHAEMPFRKITTTWGEHGELRDPHDEFFVYSAILDSGGSRIAADPYKFWERAFEIRPEQIPSYWSIREVQEVFVSGKSVAFAKQFCDRIGPSRCLELGKWGASESVLTIPSGGEKPPTERLAHTLLKVFDFPAHLRAIRLLLFLRQGDFTDSLIRVGEPLFVRPRLRVLLQDMQDVVDMALRSTPGATFLGDEFVQRIRTGFTTANTDRSTDVAPSRGFCWEDFVLTYDFSGSALSAVLGEEEDRIYRKVFRQIWRVKWASHRLNGVWVFNVKTHLLVTMTPEEMAAVEKCQRLRAEMAHFTDNLESFIYLEVIDRVWTTFLPRLEALVSDSGAAGENHSCCSKGGRHGLDCIKAIHRHMLNDLQNGLFMDVAEIQALLFDLLNACLEFASLSATVASLLPLPERKGKRTDDRSLQKPAEDPRENTSATVRLALDQLDAVANRFHSGLFHLLILLKEPDRESPHLTSIRDLRLRLDYNDYYGSGAGDWMLRQSVRSCSITDSTFSMSKGSTASYTGVGSVEGSQENSAATSQPSSSRNPFKSQLMDLNAIVGKSYHFSMPNTKKLLLATSSLDSELTSTIGKLSTPSPLHTPFYPQPTTNTNT